YLSCLEVRAVSVHREYGASATAPQAARRWQSAGEPMVPPRAPPSRSRSRSEARQERGLAEPANGRDTLGVKPKWRNWQTRRTQNPVGREARVGSIPTFGMSGQADRDPHRGRRLPRLECGHPRRRAALLSAWARGGGCPRRLAWAR